MTPNQFQSQFDTFFETIQMPQCSSFRTWTESGHKHNWHGPLVAFLTTNRGREQARVPSRQVEKTVRSRTDVHEPEGRHKTLHLHLTHVTNRWNIWWFAVHLWLEPWKACQVGFGPAHLSRSKVKSAWIAKTGFRKSTVVSACSTIFLPVHSFWAGDQTRNCSENSGPNWKPCYSPWGNWMRSCRPFCFHCQSDITVACGCLQNVLEALNVRSIATSRVVWYSRDSCTISRDKDISYKSVQHTHVSYYVYTCDLDKSR